MPSVIPGYEYDIFISYRQKDNKADKWVSQFVKALKDELEATFKVDISIYFDENPEDGLLETHDVDQSLEGKIRSLVFIPIISQTYCDPNSFAWQHEFIAFRDFAKNDELGLTLRLAGGNVCKRILPVKIHELDEADHTLYEEETGGVMRSIDFIYKAAGVNRPLMPNEVHPDDNLNGTIYRDQINKVANAVKELINSLRSPQSPSSSEKPVSGPRRSRVNKTILVPSIITVIVLAILGYWIFRDKPLVLSDSSRNARVAILPFTNNTNNQELDILGFMAADWIIKGLLDLDNVKVVSYETMTSNLASSSIKDAKTLIKFSNRIGANKVIMGSYYKQNEELVFQTQVLDVKSGEVELVLPDVSGLEDNLGELVSDLNQRVMTIYGYQESAYSRRLLRNPPKYEAYIHFHEGMKFFGVNNDISRNNYREAIAVDSSFFWPYFFIATTYDVEKNLFERNKIIEIADQYCKPYSNFQNVCLNWLFSPDRRTAFINAKIMYEKDPKNPLVNLVVGQTAGHLNRPSEAVEYFKVIDPSSFSFHSNLDLQWFRDYSYNLIRLEKYDEALELLENVPIEHYSDELVDRRTFVHVLQGMPDKIHTLISELEARGTNKRLVGLTCVSASNWYKLIGDAEQREKWAKLAIEMIRQEPEMNKQDYLYLGKAHFNTERYREAISAYSNISTYSYVSGYSDSLLIKSMIGLCHVKLNNSDQVQSTIKEFKEIGTQDSKYHLARIYLSMNNHDLSLQNLKDAFEGDYGYSIGRYDTDSELVSLHDYPEFSEFIKPKDQ